jgi:hypothetical protein
MKMEQTERSETLAYKIQTLGNYPEESTQHSEHGEGLKSRIVLCYMPKFVDIVMLITHSTRTDILGCFKCNLEALTKSRSLIVKSSETNKAEAY